MWLKLIREWGSYKYIKSMSWLLDNEWFEVEDDITTNSDVKSVVKVVIVF